jgi:hypothetical protein
LNNPPRFGHICLYNKYRNIGEFIMAVHNGNIIVNADGGAFTINAGDYIEPGPRYEGVQLQNVVPPELLNPFAPEASIIHVSGTGGNPWGHTIFQISPSVGFVHAAAAGKERVFYIPAAYWDEYVQQNNKEIWQIVPVPGWNAISAQAYLLQKLLVHFHWHIGKHDCATFCQQLATAGGVPVTGSKSMFPSKAVKRNVRRGIADLIRWN